MEVGAWRTRRPLGSGTENVKRRTEKFEADRRRNPLFFSSNKPNVILLFFIFAPFSVWGSQESALLPPPFIFLRSSRASSYCKSLFSPAATARCKNPDIAFSTLNRKPCVPRLFAHFYTPTSIVVPGKEILCVIWV